MKIVIEPTDKLTVVDGVEVRVWTGVTDRGVPVVLFVRGITCREGDGHSQLDAELQERLPPAELHPLHRVLEMLP